MEQGKVANNAKVQSKENNATKEKIEQLVITPSFDITQALSQVKMFVPLLEMMKVDEYRNTAIKFISNMSSKQQNQIQAKKTPEVYLGDTLTKNPSQVDPFYTTLLINNKLVKNGMIDSGAAINIMPMAIMKELGLWVNTTYGKCYAMDNMSVPVVRVIWDVELKLAAYPEEKYITDITMVDNPPYYGMLLSRKWIAIVGGNFQLDLSYATIPVNKKEVKLYREPRSKNVIDNFDPNQMN